MREKMIPPPRGESARGGFSPSQHRAGPPAHRGFFRHLPALCLALTLGAGAQAQTGDAAPRSAPPSLPRSVVDASETTEISARVFGEDTGWPDLGPGLLRQLRLQAAYDFEHIDGVQSRPGAWRETDLHTFAVSAQLALSPRWTLAYTPSWTFYSNDDFEDSTEHFVRLTGATSYNAWGFTFLQTYSKTSTPLVETAAQTDLDRFTTRFGASYQLNSKILLQSGLVQNLRFSDRFVDTREWSVPAWVRVQVSPILEAGAGVTLGYVDVDPGSNMTYQRLEGQLAGRLSQKVSWTVDAGVENRQFKDSDRDNLVNPLYGGSLQWAPVETTSVTLGARRRVATSLIRGAVTDRTDISIRLRQRLLEHFFLSLGAVRYDVDYEATETGSTTPTPNHERNTYSAQLSTALFGGRTHIAATYSRSENNSAWMEYDYWTTQYGIELRHTF